MDILTIVGILLGLGAIIGGNILEGGHVGSLMQLTAFVIVFGGTMGAVLVQTPMSIFLRSLKMFVWLFLPPKVPSRRSRRSSTGARWRARRGFERESGHTVKLTYAPVGALRDKIFAGEPADLTLVTPVIIEQLQTRGVVRPNTRTDLGQVGGGIAVRVGAPLPAVATPDELKRALLAAKEIYYADPTIATAGAYS